MNRMMVFGLAITLVLVLAQSALAENAGSEAGSTNSLSPQGWSQAERAKYALMEASNEAGNPVAVSEQGVVAGVYSATSVRAGVEALRQGGSAADAALTTALGQVCYAAGAWVSYSGILVALYYDAESGEVHNLNAGFNTVLGEKDALGIPKANQFPDDFYGGTSSGRATLVPGFLAGVGALHERFGKLPFSTLFGPAIDCAENGFQVNGKLADVIGLRETSLRRLPETERIFTDQQGALLGKGDTLKQPALALTLRAIAREGIGYVYRGPWAQRLVEAVQAEGGHLTMEDLARYEAKWVEPASIQFKGHTVYASGSPSYEGEAVLQALSLADVSGLFDRPHYLADAESFFIASQILRFSYLAPYFPDQLKPVLPPDAPGYGKQAAEALWPLMQEGALQPLAHPPQSKNTDAVVAVDAQGNVAVLIHTINTGYWGRTALFVDGISVQDAASYQQEDVARAGPGNRLPDSEGPVLVVRNGKPLFGIAGKGFGYHQETTQVLFNLLGYGMPVRNAVDTPSIFIPRLWPEGTDTEQVEAGGVPPEVLEAVRAMGLEVSEVSEAESGYARGLAVAVQIDPVSRLRYAASPRQSNGQAIAQ